MVPVPKARRVTLTPDLPSVTQSVAVPRAARKGRPPVPASTPAANPVFKKLRLEQSGIVALRLALSYHEFGPRGDDSRTVPRIRSNSSTILCRTASRSAGTCFMSQPSTEMASSIRRWISCGPVSYTHLRAHETVLDLVCRLLLEKQ